MKQQIILLYAGTYSVADERTGVIKEGVTCNYYFNIKLDAIDNINGTVGTRPAKGSMPVELMKKIKKAPALYDAEFEMSIGSDGKPILKICDLEFVSQVVISSFPDKQSQTAAAQKAV